MQVLFSHYYTSSFELFVALAILSEHRDIICRYLVEFDEVSAILPLDDLLSSFLTNLEQVLKYANDLSGTVSCLDDAALQNHTERH